MTHDGSAAPEWDPRKEANYSGKPLVRLDSPGDDGVAEIVFNRPEKLNAWAWNATNELCAIADDLRFDSSVRVVVMRGEGKSFCAGEDLRPERHDVKERHAGRSPAEQVRNSYERARYCFERWQVITDLPQPTEYHDLGALTDTAGYYQLNGIGRVRTIYLAVSAAGFTSPPPVPWVINYEQPVNLVDFRLRP